jgi:hypothetical protein
VTAVVRRGGRELCDDWECPAQASCGHAFWRSKAYAAMAMPAPRTRKFAREPGMDACTAYYTDKPRPWIWGDGGAKADPPPKRGRLP